MSEKMTLEQVRDWHREQESHWYGKSLTGKECHDAPLPQMHKRMADAIDAHLATLPAAVPDAKDKPTIHYKGDLVHECGYVSGWNGCRKAMLTQRGSAQDARDAARYRYLLSQMKVGAVTTQLPLYRAPYLYLSEPCDDVRHVEQAIDAAMLNDKELP